MDVLQMSHITPLLRGLWQLQLWCLATDAAWNILKNATNEHAWADGDTGSELPKCRAGPCTLRGSTVLRLGVEDLALRTCPHLRPDISSATLEEAPGADLRWVSIRPLTISAHAILQEEVWKCSHIALVSLEHSTRLPFNASITSPPV